MMNDTTLRQLQLTQLEILKVFDMFCKKYGLKYSLYAGSMLGMIRHKAFIPWDDDLDVCMEREEYNRLISLWNKDAPKGYILQNKENSPEFWQSFTKIRKDHTTFLQYEREAGRYHTGIFLDVFPLDRIPDGKFRRVIYKWNCMIYQLLTREFVPPRASRIIQIGSKVILAIIPKKKREVVRQKTLKKITRFNNNHTLEIAATETMASLRKPFAADMLNSYVYLPFEDGEFMCYAGWDDHLRRKFGDYMQLPPKNEREWKHHPIIIDFEQNYEELQYEQKEKSINTNGCVQL